MIPVLQSAAWALDIAFFVILLLGIFIGVKRGLLRFVCKIAGTIFSVVLAFMTCIPLKNATGGLFGLEAKLQSSISAVPVLGTWITIGVSFLAIAVLVRLAAWLIGIVGKSLVEHSKAMNYVDKALGGVVGLAFAALLILFLLAVCTWLPAAGLQTFIRESFIVSKIYEWPWFQSIASFSFLHA